MLVLAVIGCGSGSHHGQDGGSTSGVDDIVAACEAFDACQIDIGGLVKTEGASNCLDQFAHGHPPLRPAFVQCMAAAHGNCAMARACVGQTVHTGATCTSASTCQGTQVSDCQFGTTVTIDCTVADPRTSCMTTTGFPAECAVGSATSYHCDGDYVVHTDGAYDIEDICADFGETCRVGASGAPFCAGSGPACTAPRSDSTTIVWCDTGFEHAVDCTAVAPGVIVQHGTKNEFGTTDYCGLGVACQPGGVAATCSGNTLMLCALGQVYQLDCVAAGYTGCMTSRCTPAGLP